MWARFEKAAASVEKFAILCDAGPNHQGFGALLLSRDVAKEVLQSSANVLSANDDWEKKIVKLSRSMAPIRRSLKIVERFLEAGCAPGRTRQDTALIACDLINAACHPASKALLASDESVSSIRIGTLEALIEPLWSVNPVIKFLAASPIEDWPCEGDFQTRGKYIAIQTNQWLTNIERAMRGILSMMERHSGWRRVVEAGEVDVKPLVQALWALMPVLSWDLGLSPENSRALFFKWSSRLRLIPGLVNGPLKYMPVSCDMVLPFLAKALENCAAASAEGDEAEREKAKICAKCDLNLVFHHIFGLKKDVDGQNYLAYSLMAHIVMDDNGTEGIEYILQSVATLRAAAAIPDNVVKFSLPVRLSAVAASAHCGQLLLAATCKEPMKALHVLHSALFINCLEETTSGWTDIVRRSNIFSEFEFFQDVSSSFGFRNLLEYFDDEVFALCLHLFENDDVWLSKTRSAIPHDLDSCAMAATGARCMAEMAATMPAAIAMMESGQIAASSQGKLIHRIVPPSLLFFMAGSFHVAALGYANLAAALAAASPGDQKREISFGEHVSVLKNLAHAAHACLHAVLALQAAGRWLTPEEREKYKVESREDALSWWFLASMVLSETLVSLSAGGESGSDRLAALVSLHALEALEVMPDDVLESATKFGVFVTFSKVLTSLSEVLGPVLLPTDAPMLQRTETSSGDSAVLQQLIAAAECAEGVEQRQRSRLELLGRLPPGVCANLRCSQSVPADKLRICAGCRIARYCSSACAKYSWKHGNHKAPCQAVQRERGGGA